MTATSRPSSTADQPEDGDDAPPREADGLRRTLARTSWSTVALVAGLVALVCAALLPLLPVSVSQPEVSWPSDPSSPGRPPSS